MEAVLVYTTFPDLESAERVVREMLRRRLIACASMREHTTICISGQDIKKEREIAVVMRTDVSKWKEIKRFLREVKKNGIPMIMRIDADKLNREYSEWMAEVLGLE